jgi:hypothetical protein
MSQHMKFLAALPIAAALLLAGGATQALPIVPIDQGAQSRPELTPTEVRAGYRGGAVARGPRGGVAVARGGGYRGGGYRAGAYRGGAYRGGVYRGGRYYGGWARPGYRWAPGGAIAAGAAIGVIGAAAAASWASAPPQPGLCWYYTDPSQRSGFWDNCP